MMEGLAHMGPHQKCAQDPSSSLPWQDKYTNQEV